MMEQAHNIEEEQAQRRGRPLKGVVASVRLTTAVFAAISEMADKEGRYTTEYMRMIIEDYARHPHSLDIAG
jgi:predicted DNA-binding ribbon-helix-helix protein